MDYETQGYIYFKSRRYNKLSAAEKRAIQDIVRAVTAKTGEEYYAPLLHFVTTDCGRVYICKKYALSESTLERKVREYYVEFARRLGENVEHRRNEKYWAQR